MLKKHYSGEFIVTGKNRADGVSAVVDGGTIFGGTFTATVPDGWAVGIGNVHRGIVSGGTFIMNGGATSPY